MAHRSLSCSKTKQFTTCAGSVPYIQHHGLEGGSGHHAQLGTAAHALGERCLESDAEPADYLGRLIEIVDPGGEDEGASIMQQGAKWPKQATRIVFEVDRDMVEAVECFTTYVRRRLRELGLTTRSLRLESHTNPLPERDDTGGTADVIIDAWPVLIEGIDYKHGSGVFVPVEKNQQLRSYTLGALLEAGTEDYEEAIYTICQPRHLQAPSDGIMTESTTPAELLEWKKWLAKKAKRVDEARRMVEDGCTLDELYANGMLSVGEDGSHCTFCELKAGCPAVLVRAQELAGKDFDLDEPAEPELPDDDSLATVIPWVPFLSKWLKDVMGAGEHRLLAGGEVAGQKLVRKRSTRQWVAERRHAPTEEGGETRVEAVTEADIVRELQDDFDLERGDLYVETAPKLLSGPQVEKLVPRADRQRLNDRLLVKPEGGLTMAPEDDKRPAVTVDSGSDFEGVED